eukprot:7484710-Heterocapsa_arctica.AAC.1
MARCAAGDRCGGDRIEQRRTASLCETMARSSFGGLENNFKSKQRGVDMKYELKHQVKEIELPL